jgi:hypothetical protein
MDDIERMIDDRDILENSVIFYEDQLRQLRLDGVPEDDIRIVHLEKWIHEDTNEADALSRLIAEND